MDHSLLVKLFGFPATLVHGDTLVLDRWLWIRRRLPQTRTGERAVDTGRGTGAFSIGAALRGYRVLGLSWDERNQQVAQQRAVMCGINSAEFQLLDVRRLSERRDLLESFDVAICCENIEHILDDQRLMQDIAACLKPGGKLLLTTPYILYRPIDAGDMGPWSQTEDGGHVRRGYSKAMLRELADNAGLIVESFSSCGGVLSQKITFVYRQLSKLHPLLAWSVILPLRFLPPILDRFMTGLLGWPNYSICLEAYKPRFVKID
jgi:2-polyprenyl-3-methyl-5-hydroxy-6-metoxy-1,4-benzoquinol methylase